MKKFALLAILFCVIVLVAVFGLSGVDKRLNELKNPTPSPSIQTEETVRVSEVQPMGPVEASVVVQITSPSDKSVISAPSVTVRGRTLPLAEVFINDKETKADENGNFSVSVTLDEGDNTLMVVANDSMGNAGEAEITVTYETK